MKRPGVFLTAEWKNLLMLNYSVDPGLLEPLLPDGTGLDFFEGQTYVSLVGFEFNRARVYGIAIPFHRNFEEVNLRFYVKRLARRGVVFVREFVPKRAVAATARLLFGENYSSVPMSHSIVARGEKDVVEAEYSWGSGVGRCSMKIETKGQAFPPPEGSLRQFITEHYWGYAAQSDGASLEYEVQHPQWFVRNAERAEFSGDAARFYGEEFGKLLARPPNSAFFAEGSAVTVFKGTRVE